MKNLSTASTGQTSLKTLTPKTLSRQALIILTLAVVLSGLAAYVFFERFLVPSAVRALTTRGQSTLSLLQQHQELRLALSLHDSKAADGLARALIEGDVDVRYVVILDADGQKLAAREHAQGEAQAQNISNDDLQRIIGLHKAAEPVGLDPADIPLTREVSPNQTARSEIPDEVDGPRRSALGKVLLCLSSRGERDAVARQTILTVVSTALLVAVAFMLYFARLAGRLNRMATFAARVAAGDLLAKLPPDGGQDEVSVLAASLDEMTQKTGAMVARLQQAAQALAETSNEILTSSSQQGHSATRQASSVAETGATVTQLRETFHQAAERAQVVIDLAKKSEDSTVSGRMAVQESVAAMEQIRDQVLTISKTILGLVERTNQIGTIIDAVNDLAEQSNVLALNAAIEAAKAGEHGRGFAVVAREVRTLAERSKDSTSQVRTILLDIEKASREALGVIEEGTRKTQTGMELASRAGQSIATLDRAINESSTAAKQIASSTRQQAVGIEQIWQAMREIDRAVNESASGIRQLESTSKNIKELADVMAQIITKYRVSDSPV